MGFRLKTLAQSLWLRQPKSSMPKRVSRSKFRRRMTVESLESRRVLTAMPFGASDQDLGEFFLGTVAVTPVFLDSDGSVDASTEDWTQNHIQEVLDNIEEGLDWWVDTLAAMNSVHSLSFTVDTSFATEPVDTQYEPISRRSNDYSLYVSEFLSGQGFSTGNLESNIRRFNQAQREKHDTNWSFTMFVVPSQNDADGNFAPGGSFSRAFAFAGGLFMIVPSTRPASTFTHETGHMFWARDEYIGGGTYFARRGYYNTQNDNAADNPTPGFVQQPSIMAAGSLLNQAYANNVSPASTLAMVGWQDSDGDGIFDVLDVPHRLTGSGFLDTATGQYRFTGEALVQTLPNLNSSGLRNDITLNRIREIEYRFDDGPWTLHSAPDAYQAELDLSIAVPSGAMQIEIRARDSETTVVSNTFTGRLGRADSTLVAGINGFVWLDSNKNSLRDVGEFGPGGWTVELVDEAGELLDLRKTIEPDDYPDGILQSDFSPHLTLSSVGVDTDGRVGIFTDQAAFTSTGTKNFRGWSRGASSFQSAWTSGRRQLQANFSQATGVVEIDAIGANVESVARLEAFNGNGELVARVTSGTLLMGEVETLRIERGAADIASITVGGHSGTSVYLDNLRFGPEATTQTDSLGGYSFSALPSGSYNVLTSPVGGYRDLVPQGGGLRTAEVTAGFATVDVDFGFESDVSRWQNPVDRLDVNNDTFIAPNDVLLVVNEINRGGSRDLRGTDLASPPYVDVNGDSILAAGDVLLIVNFINARG